MILKIKSKYMDRRGETIGEVLISLLISTLAIMMLAAMIVSSGKIIKQSREAVQTYYDANNVLEQKPEASPAVSGAKMETGIIQIQKGGSQFSLDRKEINVNYYINEDKNVVSYKSK